MIFDPILNLRIASFNVRFGTANDGNHVWQLRRSHCLQTIKNLNADIICLQEPLHFQILEILEFLSDYSVSGVGRDDGIIGGEFCPVYFRKDQFRLLEESTIWLSYESLIPGSKFPNANHPRIATITDFLHLQSNSQFRVVNTHWDNELDVAKEFSGELIRKMALQVQFPCLLAGDFNAELSHSGIQRLGLQDSREFLKLPRRATYHDYGRANHEEIDHILFSPHWNPVKYEVIESKNENIFASDHFPIVVNLELRSRQTT